MHMSISRSYSCRPLCYAGNLIVTIAVSDTAATPPNHEVQSSSSCLALLLLLLLLLPTNAQEKQAIPHNNQSYRDGPGFCFFFPIIADSSSTFDRDKKKQVKLINATGITKRNNNVNK